MVLLTTDELGLKWCTVHNVKEQLQDNCSRVMHNAHRHNPFSILFEKYSYAAVADVRIHKEGS